MLSMRKQDTVELIFYQDASSHHHVPPDQLGAIGGGGRPSRLAPVGNVTARDVQHDLSNCRWQNPSAPDAPPKLVLRPGAGSLFSLADTSPEYTGQ